MTTVVAHGLCGFLAARRCGDIWYGPRPNPFKKPRTRRIAIATVAEAGIAAVSVPTYQALTTNEENSAASTACDAEFLPDGENVIPEGSDPTGSHIFGRTVDEDGQMTETVLWKDGERLDIALPEDSVITGVNASGLMVGYTHTDEETQTPFLFNGEDFHELALPEDAVGGTAEGISDDGFIIADAEIGEEQIGVTWDENCEVQQLPVPEGMENPNAADIDGEGSISGFATDADDVFHPFVWRDGEPSELPAVTGDEEPGGGAAAWHIAGDWAVGDNQESFTQYLWNADEEPESIEDGEFGWQDVNSSGQGLGILLADPDTRGAFLASPEGEVTEITGRDDEGINPTSITEDGQIIGSTKADDQPAAAVFNCD